MRDYIYCKLLSTVTCENDSLSLEWTNNKVQSYRQVISKILGEFEGFGEDGVELVNALSQNPEFVRENLRFFGEGEIIGKDLTKKFIEEQDHSLVFENIDRFEYYDGVVKDIIKYGDYGWFVDILKRFWDQFEKWSSLEVKDYDDILIAACDRRRKRDFAEFILEKGKGFTEKSLDKLIEWNKWDSELLGKNLKKFGCIDHNIIVKKLIDAGRWRNLVENLKYFQGVNLQEVIDELVKREKFNYVLSYLDPEILQCVDLQGVVDRITESEGRSDYRIICSNLEKLKSVDHQKLVDNLIKIGQGKIVLYYKGKFQGVNRSTTMNKLYESLELGDILDNIGVFPGGMHKEIISRIDLEDDYLIRRLSSNMNAIKCTLSTEIAERLCDIGYVDCLFSNIDKFEMLNVKIAKIFMERGYYDIVLKSPERFGLKKEIK